MKTSYAEAPHGAREPVTAHNRQSVAEHDNAETLRLVQDNAGTQLAVAFRTLGAAVDEKTAFARCKAYFRAHTGDWSRCLG
jgi:hypothetical protein